MASVLVVDDSVVMRKSLISLLTQAGYSIAAEATNGEEAVKEYAKCHPDYVTMDINMPKVDGIEAVKQIIAEHPEARIIMISAIDEKNNVIDALKSGAKNYILKPVTYEKVLEALQKIAK